LGHRVNTNYQLESICSYTLQEISVLTQRFCIPSKQTWYSE